MKFLLLSVLHPRLVCFVMWCRGREEKREGRAETRRDEEGKGMDGMRWRIGGGDVKGRRK